MYYGRLEALWTLPCPEDCDCPRSVSCSSCARFYCVSAGSHNLKPHWFSQSILVVPEDIPETAITTPFGLFEFFRMPFGLRNETLIFKHFMNQVLQGQLLYAYIDVLISSSSPEEHPKYPIRFPATEWIRHWKRSQELLAWFFRSMLMPLAFSHWMTMFKSLQNFLFLTHRISWEDSLVSWTFIKSLSHEVLLFYSHYPPYSNAQNAHLICPRGMMMLPQPSTQSSTPLPLPHYCSTLMDSGVRCHSSQEL